MDQLPEKIIELSKAKLLLLIAGSSLFVAAGVWMLQMDAAEIAAQRRFNSPLAVYGIGAAAVLFFGLCGVAGIKKLFDKRPGLVLSAQGMLDNSSGVSAGQIPWSEVIGFSLYETHGQKMLVVLLKDPEKYVEAGSSMRRRFNRMNFKMCGSPVVISANALKVRFADLQSLCNTYWDRYGKQA